MTGAQDALSRGLLRASPEQRVGKLAGIEAGRGIAAIGVVLCHVALILTKTSDAQTSVGVFQIGRAGVDFFFVLSGFIIAYAHREDIGCPARLGHYLSRRLFRIMPTYWIALALTLMLGGYTLPAFDMARAALLLPSSHGLPVIVAWTLQVRVGLLCGIFFPHRLQEIGGVRTCSLVSVDPGVTVGTKQSLGAAISLWTTEYRVFSGDGCCLFASEAHRAGTEVSAPHRVWSVLCGGDCRRCGEPRFGQSSPNPLWNSRGCNSGRCGGIGASWSYLCANYFSKFGSRILLDLPVPCPVHHLLMGGLA